MSRLVLDAVSARTLPVLDKLYQEDYDKFEALVEKTAGEPLERLLKASIARQVVLGRPLRQEQEAARLVELLIHNNIFSTPGDRNEEEVDEVLNVLSDVTRRMLLKISIIRFVLLTPAQ